MPFLVIREPIYKTKVTFVFKDSKESAISFLNEMSGKDFTEQLKNSMGFFHGITQHDIFLAITDDAHENWESVLAHEAFHLTCFVMRARGLKIHQHSEEAFAYYLGWIVEKFAEAYKKTN